MSAPEPPFLTYCTNIHPGEGWKDVLRNLESHLVSVKAATSPDRPFPVGLRLSSQAACELDAGEAKRFGEWLEREGCFVLTVNGFPYGPFHGAAVKKRVYEPDWRLPERVAYTLRLADLLVEWLPDGVAGSISTVPIAFETGFEDADWQIVRRHLIEVLEHLDAIRQQRGVEIALAIEPEPRCVLETTPEVLACFERLALPAPLSDLATLCFDCCHQAVEFEDPASALEDLGSAGIRLGKVQVSSSLRAVGDEIRELARFDEPTYLHQVVARTEDGTLLRYDDLPDFAAAEPAGVEECRVHFHVPIFAEHLGYCGTTRFFLEQALPLLDPATPLEVETYSFDALPEELRRESVAESIVRELEWAKGVRA